jgi:hypothetical protein
MNTRRLPPFVKEMLATPPRASEGVHAYLFRVSRQLHAHMPAGEIVTLLENRVRNCGRPVPRSEIVSAVQNSLGCAWQPGGDSRPSVQPAPKWPITNKELREAIVSNGGGLPVRHTEAI